MYLCVSGMCVCGGGGGGEGGSGEDLMCKEYNVYILLYVVYTFLRFYVYICVDFVKHGTLTSVSETLHYRMTTIIMTFNNIQTEMK